MRTIEYLYLGMLILALVLIYYAVKNYYFTQDLMSDGYKTRAKVIHLIEVPGDNGYTYKPVFEYIDKRNSIHTYESEVSSSPPSYNIGDTVEIVYSEDNEERKVISFWGLYRWTVILLCIASPLLIISGGYFLYAKM